MKDLSLFGTEAYPLHPSGLASLVVCPWREVMRFMFDSVDEGGPAGDTGSAMHHAAATMHRGGSVTDALIAMRENVQRYPRADLVDAAEMFLKYAADPRNRDIEVVAVEEKLSFSIAPAPEDPTQAPIQVIGTVDQVRRVKGVLHVYDIKTSKKDPMQIRDLSTMQIAAYCIGAAVKFSERVNPGAVICPRKYRESNHDAAPVFWHFPWTFDDIERILFPVRHTIALIRSGKLWHVPNVDCTWCPARTPDVCLPKLKSL